VSIIRLTKDSSRKKKRKKKKNGKRGPHKTLVSTPFTISPGKPPTTKGANPTISTPLQPGPHTNNSPNHPPPKIEPPQTPNPKQKPTQRRYTRRSAKMTAGHIKAGVKPTCHSLSEESIGPWAFCKRFSTLRQGSKGPMRRGVVDLEVYFWIWWLGVLCLFLIA
jgi:hypothetical protein